MQSPEQITFLPAKPDTLLREIWANPDRWQVDERVFEETIKNLTLQVRQWTVKRTDLPSFIINVSREKNDAIKGIHHFQITFECLTDSWKILAESQLKPRFVPHRYYGHRSVNREDVEHRYADPLDPWMTLKTCATSAETDKWCRERVNQLHIGEKMAKVADNRTAQVLYEQTPQELMVQAEQVGEEQLTGMALYYYLHMWETQYRYSLTELVDLVEDINSVSLLNLGELQMLLHNHRWHPDKVPIAGEIVDEIGEQANFLVGILNEFVRWQLENEIHPHVLLWW